MAIPSFALKGKLETDFNGHCQILSLYHHAKHFGNSFYKIDVDGLYWIDANQTALLLTIINKLKKENGLKFIIDYTALKGDLNILARNGFAYHAVYDKKYFEKDDPRNTTIPIKAFKVDSADSFVDYIEKELLKHRGLENVAFADKERVKNSYFEIFDNVGIHANTNAPILACGQFYPEAEVLKFTLVDLGGGFLKGISEFTKDNEKITRAADAILWAVKGGSTKKEAQGGTGLKGILSFCRKSGGELHIATDNCYWLFSGTKFYEQSITKPFIGTTIHLVFRYLKAS